MLSASDIWWFASNMHCHWPLWYLHVLCGVWWWKGDVEPQVWQIPRSLERWGKPEGTRARFWMVAHFQEWRKIQVEGFPLAIKGIGSADMYLVLTMDKHWKGISFKASFIGVLELFQLGLKLMCLFFRWVQQLVARKTRAKCLTNQRKHADFSTNQTTKDRDVGGHVFPRLASGECFCSSWVIVLSAFGVIGQRIRFIRSAFFTTVIKQKNHFNINFDCTVQYI